MFTCVAFSVAAHVGVDSNGGMGDWCIFCWAFSFACTLLVLLVEQFGLQARVPVSWNNFPITVACYAALYASLRGDGLHGYGSGLVEGVPTFVACVIFILVSNPVSYDSEPALQCTGCLPIPFSKFLSAYGLLAVIMYLTATIIWPVFQFDKRYGGIGKNSSKVIAAAVLTGLNFLLYLADLAYTARLLITVSGHCRLH
uniref:Myeloid associated differentiation marker a n=1 Tax=Lates calcarifer TaxID=8187 RepID=A0A4W6EW52_LATCA